MPALKILEIAKAIEPVQDGRIHIEKINEPFLYSERGTPTEYRAGIKLTIERGWLWMHENGTYVKITQTGADCSLVEKEISERSSKIRSTIPRDFDPPVAAIR